MDRSTKLLIFSSVLVFFLGLGFLWFGLRPATQLPPTPPPTPLVENTPEATSSGSLGIEGERVLVTAVIDGDTIKVKDGQTVRLIGIDTPETKHPRKSVQCFGKEASNETKNLLEGKAVILQKDVSETDQYKRVLRYVFLPLENGELLFVNDYLVREGFARVLTYPPDVKYNEQFREAEREAKENKKGLWGKC